MGYLDKLEKDFRDQGYHADLLVDTNSIKTENDYRAAIDSLGEEFYLATRGQVGTDEQKVFDILNTVKVMRNCYGGDIPNAVVVEHRDIFARSLAHACEKYGDGELLKKMKSYADDKHGDYVNYILEGAYWFDGELSGSDAKFARFVYDIGLIPVGTFCRGDTLYGVEGF